VPDRKRLERRTTDGTTMPWGGLAGQSYRDPREAAGLTAAAEVLDDFNTRTLVIPPTEWQREAWAFYHTLGELEYAIGTWLAGCMSRVRLVPAIKRVGEDDPSPIVDGPIADMVADLAGGIGGQAALMRRLAVQLSVPGDSYLVGEARETGNDWRVYSSDEIRIKSRGARNLLGPVNAPTRLSPFGVTESTVRYEVNVYRNEWRNLNPDSLVVRCWVPDEQFAWAANSPCQSALPILREIDFYNRYIISVLLSRLALNGLLLMPSEVTFPAKPQYKDAADPFVAELLDIATRSIKNPGSAAAALPMPVKVPAAMIEKFKHLTFDTEMGKEVMANRTRALERMAVSVNIPTEVITGVSNMNHWGQWQLEESAIKIYISPIAEVICTCLTEGFLWPMMRAAGMDLVPPDGGQYLVWYDASKLSQQPDRTTEAQAIFDRGGLTLAALRRESGFEEDDAPSMDELKDIVLTKIAMGAGAQSLDALAALTGDESLVPPPPPAPVAGEPGSDSGALPADENSPPATGQSPSGQPKAPPATQPAVVVVPSSVAELEQLARR
jgi:hypothetical protein